MVSLYDEYALNSLANAETLDSEIFNLRRLEWSKQGQDSNRELRKVSIGNNVLVAATTTCTLLRRNLNIDNGAEEEIEISRRREDSIDHVFIDPSGNHTIIVVSNGDNFYLHSRSTRPKKFSSKMQGNIESIAFDRTATDASTKSFLAGTSAGCVYEICFDSAGKEKLCSLVYQLDPKQPMSITSLHFDSTGPGENVLIMLATSHPTRLYHFYGPPSGNVQWGEGSFSQVFARIRGDANYTQLPGDLARAELQLFKTKGIGKSPAPAGRDFALMTNAGIYHGSALVKAGPKGVVSASDCIIAIEADLRPYCDTYDPPLSIVPSEYHFISLHYDKLLCISSLDGSLVQEEMLRVADGNAIGLVRDTGRGTLWLYTDSYVFQIGVQNENQHIWSIYLTKALAGETKLFDVAYDACNRKEEQAQVMNARAEFVLRAGNAEQAAVFFAKSGAAFEDVVLRLLCAGNSKATKDGEKKIAGNSNSFTVTNGPELSAIRTYLLNEIQVLPAKAKSQRTMICTWLSEIYLHQITMAGLARDSVAKVGGEDEDINLASSILSEEELVTQFKAFLREMKQHLDPATTVALISSRGRAVHRDLLLSYVRIIGDYDRVVGHLITEQQYKYALQVLSDASLDRAEELIYKFAPVLIRFQPEATVEMLLSKKKLRVSGTLPALLRYSSLLDAQYKVATESYSTKVAAAVSAASSSSSTAIARLDMDKNGAQVNFAIKYLQECVLVREGPMEVIVFHTLLWFLAKYDNPNEAELCAYLEKLISMKQEGLFATIKLNCEYIVRQCKLFKRRRGIVYAYFLIGMDYEAVEAALKVDISLAKKVARNPKDPDQKKRLWLIISQHVIKTDSDAKRALLLIKESDGTLKIEDLLPLLPDFTEIDLFKEDICSTLEDCSQRIDNLKSEMEELSESAEGINSELESMKKRGYSVSSLQRCEYCMSALFSRQFYLFPCSHGFHNDCMLGRVHSHKHLDEPQLEAVKILDGQIRAISNRAKDDKRAMAQLEFLQNELDGFVAADCPLCGYVMIRSLALPLISPEDSVEAKSWDL